MKAVLRHILQRKRAYSRLPFFDFLRNDSLTPHQRLSFFPCMAPFILAFGDFNAQVLRDLSSTDPHQQMINAHSFEDDHHWPWYLEDWAKLGHDAPQAPSDTMRALFSDATRVNRLLAYRLSHLVWSCPPAVRLAVVEAIEETGNVLFDLTTKLAKAVEGDSGVELRYCGDFHFALESGHAMNNEHAVLARIELDEAQRADAITRADQVFTWFAEWTDELLAYALATLASQQDQPMPAATTMA